MVAVADGTVASMPEDETTSKVVEVRLAIERSVDPAPPVLSAAGAQVVPSHLRTCPVEAPCWLRSSVISFVPMLSVTEIVELPFTVITPDPEVFEVMVAVFAPPAPTARLPSLEFELSAAVSVIVFPDSVTKIPAVPWIITGGAPEVLDCIPDEFPVAVVTVNTPSLDTSESDSLYERYRVLSTGV